MWPFNKKPKNPQPLPMGAIGFTQLDITEGVGDNRLLTENDWVPTSALNEITPDPHAHGLPPRGASDEAVYEAAARLSRVREIFSVATDGVYCPTCHVANTSLSRLRTPCPKCGRPLLRFDWT